MYHTIVDEMFTRQDLPLNVQREIEGQLIEGMDPLEELSQLAASLGLTPEPLPQRLNEDPAARPGLPSCKVLLGCSPSSFAAAAGTTAATPLQHKAGSSHCSVTTRAAAPNTFATPLVGTAPDLMGGLLTGGSKAVAKAMVSLQERVQALQGERDELAREVAALCDQNAQLQSGWEASCSQLQAKVDDQAREFALKLEQVQHKGEMRSASLLKELEMIKGMAQAAEGEKREKSAQVKQGPTYGPSDSHLNFDGSAFLTRQVDRLQTELAAARRESATHETEWQQRQACT